MYTRKEQIASGKPVKPLTEDERLVKIQYDNGGGDFPDPASVPDGKVLTTDSGAAVWGDAPSGLPEIEETDEGKVLAVDQGEAVWADAPSGLPEITNADEGKVLTVVEDDSGDTPVYNAEWAEIPDQLPTIAAGDAGKVLTVNVGETGAEWAVPSGGGGLSILQPNFTITVTETYNSDTGNYSYTADKTYAELQPGIYAANPNMAYPCLMIYNHDLEGSDQYTETLFCNALFYPMIQGDDYIVITSQPITGWMVEQGLISCRLWELRITENDAITMDAHFIEYTEQP